MAKKKKVFFENLSNKIALFTGSSVAFVVALFIVIIWALTGPVFGYSQTWQLVINTGTTIITFLMVFLIQKAQNKDSKAIQLKLNELIAASPTASNRMVDIEDLSEDELEKLHIYYAKISNLAAMEGDINKSHSVGAAEKLHRIKKDKRLPPRNSRPPAAETTEQSVAALKRRRKKPYKKPTDERNNAE